IELLQNLNDDPANSVVVISGRDHRTLENWLHETGVDLVAEHGARVRRQDGRWTPMDEGGTTNWQEEIRPVMEVYVDRTPGAYLEDKGSALVWHYRRAEPELGSLRAKELIDTLEAYLSNTTLHVMQGDKVIEVKESSVNKGRAAQRWLRREEPYDFILAIGDDVTDEDLFASLPEDSYSIKVGRAPQSKARYYIRDADRVRGLLKDLESAGA
ncbi:MAG: trehalose-phosphatase, partial [Anaerolineales bacterium]|nr:trehalose-phosphatase [Anaerolineales bacterium]